MPHIITQSCCSDGSCVYACPVNCIHPSPDEPGFATAEMLYIDPVACVDCGACVSACPVGAIAPDSRLTDNQLPFIPLNAAFYPERPADVKLPPTSKLAPVLPAPQIRRGGTDSHGGCGRLGARGDVRRRRTAHPERGAGQRLRQAAHPVRIGARRGRPRSPEHQGRDADLRADQLRIHISRSISMSKSASIFRMPSCWSTTTPCSTPSVRRTTAGSTSPGWSCRDRHRHRDRGLVQRPPGFRRADRRPSPRTRRRDRQRQCRPRRRPGS